MSMFGKNWRDGLATLGATLSDVGSALNHTEGGYLDRLRAQRRFEAERQSQQYGAVTPDSARFPAAPRMRPLISSLPGYGFAGEAAKARAYDGRADMAQGDAGFYVPGIADPYLSRLDFNPSQWRNGYK